MFVGPVRQNDDIWVLAVHQTRPASHLPFPFFDDLLAGGFEEEKAIEGHAKDEDFPVIHSSVRRACWVGAGI